MRHRLVAAAVAACLVLSVGVPATAFAQKAGKATAAESDDEAAKPGKKERSPAQKAQHQRMKDCGAQWQKVKADGKTAGKTWNEFSGECMKKKN